MGLWDIFKPRQDRFVRLLIEQASKTLEGMEAGGIHEQHRGGGGKKGL